MRDLLTRFVTTDPMTPAEFERTIQVYTRSILSEYRNSSNIIGAMQTNDLYGRPDNYFTTLPSVYTGLTVNGVNQAFRAAVDPSKVVWFVVGDAAKVRPQLSGLGLPIEEITEEGKPR